MPTPFYLFLLIFAVALVTFLAGFFVRMHVSRGRILRSEEAAREHARSAELAFRAAEVEARERLQEIRESAESELRELRRALDRREQELSDRERETQVRLARLGETEAGLVSREDRLAQAEEHLRARIRQAEGRERDALARLEALAGLSREAARERVLRQVEEETRSQAARAAAQIRDTALREADREARRVIALAIQRLASEHTIESTVTVVDLPSDDMKGRIIGKEGRNIRAFEAATGVDVIIDDTPEAVLLSSFDPVRREIARRALGRLMEDGRIHPGRIEEIVQRVNEEVRSEHADAGERVSLEARVPGLTAEVLELLGRLEYRTSFGQNVLRHSSEVAHLSGLLASELGLEPAMARRVGLLHDVGKSLDQDHEGSHALAGAEFLRRAGERAEVVEAVAAHHGEKEPTTAYAWLLQAADAISGARPGARREKLETYLKRLEQLESIANAFPGVDRSFAIQAGRELRVLVQSREVTDGDANALASSVAARIEKELQYPGQIKVVVIRETRAVDIAR